MKIKCDKKEYEIPDLDVDQWRKVIKIYNKATAKADSESLFTDAGIDASLEFYFALLNPHYPELTKNKLGKMPLYQLAGPFTIKVFQTLTEIPLDSENAEEEKA